MMKPSTGLVTGFTCLIASFCSAQTSTMVIEIPSQGAAFTSTLAPCGTGAPIEIVAVPNGTLFHGTDAQSTQVVIAKLLPGTCQPDPSSPATASKQGADGCPTQACSTGMSPSAELVIGFLGMLSTAEEELQQAVKEFLPSIQDKAARIATDLSQISSLPPFPAGCDSDTIAVALMDFVETHQALLKLLIGSKDMITGNPLFVPSDLLEAFVGSNKDIITRTSFFVRSDADHGGDIDTRGLVVWAIAGALRSVETAVNASALELMGLVPARQTCLQGQKASLDETLEDAIATFQA
ncbi:hypothetical protein F5Y16DRAFT_394889 [Xylariaceae sp. FL0255]|nr:hypothetical protein F5Y16DRAFT_394889 [Xylariaceae sp. FL0255]